MEIRIGISNSIEDNGFSPYFWISNQGFHLDFAEDLETAEWMLNNLKIAFEKIPGVIVRRIEGTGFYGGIDK
jgi:hypothetical protein